MTITSRITLRVIISLVLTFLLLYVIGNLSQVKSYTQEINLPIIKLVLLNAFLFITMSISLYFLIDEFLKFRLKQNIFLIGIIAISLFLAYSMMAVPDTQGHVVGLSYILVGDYLRDTHGINIYFMDWAGWAITMVLYLTAIFSFLIFEASKRFLPRLFRN